MFCYFLADVAVQAFHLTFGEVLCAGFFSAWLVLTVLRQLTERKPRWMQKLDPIRIVPSWRMFGPRPPSADFHLEVKCKTSGNRRSQWLDLTPHRPRSWSAFLWNPDRRLRKMFNLSSRSVSRVAQKRSGRRVARTSGYRLLLGYVTSFPTGSYGTRRRFRISRRQRFLHGASDTVLFTSRRYRYSALGKK
jgi:hypothetical protein